MCTNFSQKLNVIEVSEPVSVVYDESLALREINDLAHLLLEALNIVVDGLNRHHLTHVSTSGRIADHTRAAAHERDRSVACLLHVAHYHHLNEVAYVK